MKALFATALFLLLLICGVKPLFADSHLKIANLQYSVRFYFAKEKDADEEVLFMEQSIKNIGTSVLVFSLYGSEPYLSYIGPKQHLQPSKIPYRLGLLRAPKNEDIVHLSPGKVFRSQSWYWADGIFPFPEKHQTEMTMYAVPDKTLMEVALCTPLHDSNERLKAFLKPDEMLVDGILCSEKTEFRYRLLLR